MRGITRLGVLAGLAWLLLNGPGGTWAMAQDEPKAPAEEGEATPTPTEEDGPIPPPPPPRGPIEGFPVVPVSPGGEPGEPIYVLPPGFEAGASTGTRPFDAAEAQGKEADRSKGDRDEAFSRNLPRRLAAKLPEIGSIQPNPPAAIPDNPPPHEGAMINIPLTVEPPDLLLVEVLEALPGRPITGKTLVRPDGTIDLGFYGSIQVRGLTPPQIKTKVILHLRTYLTDEVLGLCGVDESGYALMIMPEESDRVMVDLAAYNSHVYYVQGDVAAPGRLPITGNETVLDAINWAGSLAPTANPQSIALYRPARGDQPKKVYPIDLEAIQQGDAESNLQLFPGDRIVVGRDPIVATTLRADRLAFPLDTFLKMLQQVGTTARSLNLAMENSRLTAEQREALIRDFVAFWWAQTSRPEGEPLDDEAVKAQLRRLLDATAPRDEPEPEPE